VGGSWVGSISFGPGLGEIEKNKRRRVPKKRVKKAINKTSGSHGDSNDIW